MTTELNFLTVEYDRGAQLRSKIIWAEHGEKNSKYFLNLEKSKGKKKLISFITLPDGSISYDQDKIIQEQYRFYAHLYRKKGEFCEEKLNTFLQDVNIPKLTAEISATCEGLTPTECKHALDHMKVSSSPGSDGLTTSWYRVFWRNISNTLVNSFNTSYKSNSLSLSQRRGIITLLHKGKNLSRNELGNLRPISLTNTDYKILAKSLANRLKKVAGEIINEDQNGYLKGRHSGIVIRAVDDIIEYTDTMNMSGAILSLDYSKAFDSISKEFMLKSLHKFGFGPGFINWISILNSCSMSCILYNGWLSGNFPLECGIRQGCPISPLCFILACELLACKIRQTPNIKGINLSSVGGEFCQIKIAQYADDTTLFLEDEHSIYESLDVIQTFSEISCLKLNRNKTTAIWIGCWKYRRKNDCWA